jgi:predicted GNAT family N-acyltransferase
VTPPAWAGPPPSIGGVTIEPVTAEQVRPLRHAVLRPHQSPEELVYPGDDAPRTLHVAATGTGGEIVGVATISQEPHPRAPRAGDWRVRGMATVPEVRGRRVGAGLLQACVEHARAQGGARVWCTARTTAAGFYTGQGFVVEGDEFELPGIGLHVLMSSAV